MTDAGRRRSAGTPRQGRARRRGPRLQLRRAGHRGRGAGAPAGGAGGEAGRRGRDVGADRSGGGDGHVRGASGGRGAGPARPGPHPPRTERRAGARAGRRSCSAIRLTWSSRAMRPGRWTGKAESPGLRAGGRRLPTGGPGAQFRAARARRHPPGDPFGRAAARAGPRRRGRRPAHFGHRREGARGGAHPAQLRTPARGRCGPGWTCARTMSGTPPSRSPTSAGWRWCIARWPPAAAWSCAATTAWRCWVRLLAAGRISHVSLVPTMLGRLLDADLPRPLPARLRRVLVGGSGHPARPWWSARWRPGCRWRSPTG